MEERSDGAHVRHETEAVDEAEPDDRPAGLEGVASYEDGDAFVVCDRKNPQAWIRSDAVTDLDP
jgi:hypothetical protein